MTVLSISPRELEQAALERGGVFVRHGGNHDVWRGPFGTFTVPSGRRKPITGRMVSTAAKALGTTTKALLEH